MTEASSRANYPAMSRIVWTNDAGAQSKAVKVFACVLSAAPISATPTVTHADVPASILFAHGQRQPSPKWADIIRRLDLYAALGDAWDGQHAAKVSAVVLDRARQAVAHLQAVGATAPSLGLASDGELDLVWDDDERSASVAFLRNGEVMIFVYDPDWDRPFRSIARTFDPRDLEPVLDVVQQIGIA